MGHDNTIVCHRDHWQKEAKHEPPEYKKPKKDVEAEHEEYVHFTVEFNPRLIERIIVILVIAALLLLVFFNPFKEYVAWKKDGGCDLPHEVMLTVDAGTGQNALSQIEHFRGMVGVTSLSVSKLDGTAKGGIIVAIAEKYGLPIRFIGVGEAMDDLRPFVAYDYARALLPEHLESTQPEA